MIEVCLNCTINFRNGDLQDVDVGLHCQQYRTDTKYYISSRYDRHHIEKTNVPDSYTQFVRFLQPMIWPHIEKWCSIPCRIFGLMDYR